MGEFLYDQSSVLMAVILMLLMAVAVEWGYRLGLRIQHVTSEHSKLQVNSIQTSLIGVLALMLGFTFSIALDRFNARSSAVVLESNAIGTAYLRSQLLPAPVREQTQVSLREYVRLRLQASQISLDRQDERDTVLLETIRLQDALWAYAVKAAEEDSGPVTTGLYVQALNGLIDAYGMRSAELDRHVPEFVLILLFSAFIISGGIIGYTAGLYGSRPARVTYLMVSLIVLLMFMVVDLDRPRRGIIQVSQQSLFELDAAVNKP